MSVTREPIKTKQAEGRREVRYQSLDEFLGDAERLGETEVRTVGNWSQGQIYEHLARALNMSIDGDKPLPWPLRVVMNLFFKKKFLDDAIPPGFKTPGKFVPEPISVADGLDALREAVERQGMEAKRALHPGFGKLSREEWDKFHLRHAEMHMSFIVD